MSKEFKRDEQIAMPGMLIPSYRQAFAKQEGHITNALIYAIGGIGDLICAEPAIRWAMKNYTGWTWTIATHHPELFRHLDVKEFIDLKVVKHAMTYYEDKYNCFCTLYPTKHLHNEFIVPMWTNVIDYHSIALWRCQLPISEKSIKLVPNEAEINKVKDFQNCIVIHPGKTWKSRTIPTWWWNEFVSETKKRTDRKIVIIGNNSVHPERGTVEIDATDCIDLREQLTLMESVALCQSAAHVVTNDSAPLHMGASGTGQVWFAATAKRAEYITHWRNGLYGSGMYDIARGGLYDSLPMYPNYGGPDIVFSECTDEEMKGWLHDPKDVAKWMNHG